MKRKSHDPAWLIARGYDGLCVTEPGAECGCSVHDFAPCGEGPFPECVPADERDDGFYPSKRRYRGTRTTLAVANDHSKDKKTDADSGTVYALETT